MRKFILSILTFSVCWSTYLTAQIIPFQNFTVKNGLPSNIIYDIEQDQLGYLWFATQVGAVKFDGYNFTTFSIENGLPDNNIIDIFIDSRNRIWLATETGGLAVLTNNEIKVFNLKNGLVSNNSKKTFEDNQHNIWSASDEGISIIRSDTIINYENFNSEPLSEINLIYVAIDGTVWICTSEQLYYYNHGFHEYENPSLRDVLVNDMCEDKKGSYWFATDKKGIFHIEGKEIHNFTTKNGLCSNRTFALSALSKDTVIVSCSYPGGLYKIAHDQIVYRWEDVINPFMIQQILVDQQKRIWLSTPENGLLLVEKNIISHIDEKNNLSNNRVYKLFEDLNGNIWTATDNGLSKYGKIIFQIFNEGFLDDKIKIRSIASLNNSVYIGTYSGLNIIRENQIVRRNKGIPSFKAFILSILPINEEKIWFGTDVGLTFFHNKVLENFPFSISFNMDYPPWATDLKHDGDEIFCATDRGLVKFYKNQFTLFETNKELDDKSIWSIEIDSLHNIWCATVNGLSIFDGIRFHDYDTTHGLPHRYCNDLAFDREGFAWVATEKGLSRIRLKNDWTIECTNLDKSKGMKSDIVFSVLVDKEGYIWAGHNKGLDRVDPADLHITHYGAIEGFLPIETSLGAATTTSGRDLWFGTEGGAVRYIHANDFIHNDPPLQYITNIKFFEDTSSIFQFASGVDPISKLPIALSLPYNKNNLIFSYVGIHYTIIEKNQYKYILEGYDNEWSSPTNSIETPPYRKIPPGNYTFKMLAANCDGIWSEKPVEFSFAVRPPFYKTWWFYIIETIFGITLLFSIMWLRVRKLKHDKKVLTQKVKERTVEIEKQRDQIALQKKEITDSIVYAERIQSAVLPDQEYINKLLNEYFILFKPRNIVSGDFYWFSQVQEQVIVVAADCTGHGVPGAFMSMLGITILNEIVSSKNSTQAGKILDTLRMHLTKTLGQTGKEDDAKDGMDLALCILDYSKMKLQFAGAYNPLIHIRANVSTIYKGDKMPVGIHLGEMPPFKTHEIDLKKDDCLYIFSDGYADQFGGPDGKKFKSAQFVELLVKISPMLMEEQKARLNETIIEWMGINEQIDDIMVIGIRV